VIDVSRSANVLDNIDMDPSPYLRSPEFGYENIEGYCGLCKHFLVINRSTDLRNSSWASGAKLPGPKCGGEIEIRGETANHPVDLFWMQESFVLYLQRRYMQSAIVLGQALELALSLCAENVFVHDPVERDPTATKGEHETLRKAFAKRILSLSLGGLRRLTVSIAVRGVRPTSIKEAIAAVAKVKQLISDRDSTPAAVAAIPDEATREAVELLLSSPVVEVRNSVAHQLYRPTQAEIEQMRIDVSKLIRQTMKAFGVTPGGGQLLVGPPAG
jgi:hypothetical protein